MKILQFTLLLSKYMSYEAKLLNDDEIMENRFLLVLNSSK